MNWYTIYTKPNSEKKVADILTCKKILHFCPKNTISEQLKKIKNNEDFNRYVFVKVSESQIAELKQISGVINVLYWRNRPAIVNECEIDFIKSFLNKYTNVKIERKELGFDLIPGYAFNSQKENEGKLINMNNNKIQVALPSLGFLMIGEFEKPIVHFTSPEDILGNSKSQLKYRIAT